MTRVPWPADFPEVVIHTDVRSRDAHAGYGNAKAGDAEWALVLAIDLLRDAAVAALRQLTGDRLAHLLPVIAEETAGFNAIPTPLRKCWAET